MIWILQLLSYYSLQSLLFIPKNAMGVCVAVYFCTSWVCVGGHMGVSRALKDSTALCYRRGEGGQRVNGRFCPAAPSVSETESAVLFRLPLFCFCFFVHHTRLSSLPLSFFLSHLCLHVGCGKSMLVDVWFRTGNQVVFLFFFAYRHWFILFFWRWRTKEAE